MDFDSLLKEGDSCQVVKGSLVESLCVKWEQYGDSLSIPARGSRLIVFIGGSVGALLREMLNGF